MSARTISTHGRKAEGLSALPLPPNLLPMEAKLVDRLPTGGGWQYEPKWDGFRCLAFRSGSEVSLRSKSGRDLTRFFPEIRSLLQGFPSQGSRLTENSRSLGTAHFPSTRCSCVCIRRKAGSSGLPPKRRPPSSSSIACSMPVAAVCSTLRSLNGGRPWKPSTGRFRTRKGCGSRPIRSTDRKPDAGLKKPAAHSTGSWQNERMRRTGRANGQC